MTKPSLNLRIEVFYKDACGSENIKEDSWLKFEQFCGKHIVCKLIRILCNEICDCYEVDL